MPNMYRNGIIRRNRLLIPDIFINLINGKYPSLILNEKKQNIILNRRKLHNLAIHLHFLPVIIHHKSARCINMLTLNGNSCSELGIPAKL